MVLTVHPSTSLVDRIHPDSFAAVDLVVELGRIHFLNSAEKTTRIVLEAVVIAVAAGNLSNFDSLEFERQEKNVSLQFMF
jgi:ATP-dependent protease HslVU (ClpYQ) peptidase subunit